MKGPEMERLKDRLLSLLYRRRERRRSVPLAERFALYRTIGAANDAFLHQLAGLLEEVDGSAIARRSVAVPAAKALSDHIGSMVRSLVAMSGGRHEDLLLRYEMIDRSLRPHSDESGPLIVWPADTGAVVPGVVGPKTARLAEVPTGTGLKVPQFFVISAYGYSLFMQASGVSHVVDELLEATDFRDPGALRKYSESAAAAVAEAPFPRELEDAMLGAYRRLWEACPGLTGVAVRSSAVAEDTASSFAGQFESVLNVTEADLPAAYKRVVASKYHLPTLQYALARGLIEKDITMPVMVMAMVEPAASGVAYSRAPGKPDSAMITAVPGLAQAIVEGIVTPDTYLVSADEPARIESSSLGNRAFSLRCAAGGGLSRLEDPGSAAGIPALDQETVFRVARAARALEEYFGTPQDVEWALDDAGTVIVVQTRPVNVSEIRASTPSAPSRIEGYRILVQGGARASGGVATGRVFHLLDPQNIEAIPEGSILCIPTTSPRLAGVMGIVRGIIAATGSPTGHMATIAREFDIPCLVSPAMEMSGLQDGMTVTLDADACMVYEGEVRELSARESSARKPPRRIDPARDRLQEVLQNIAPLTLSEPDSPDFRPDNCRTLHDIARYVHQKSMMEMFEFEDLSAQERRCARRLLWRVPMEVFLIDLGGGLREGTAERGVPTDRVASVPLLALMEGMTDPRLRWAGPVGFDLRGFVSVVVRSAADDQRYGEPNYCLCAADYVHFATRLAYHFATVDSICGGSVNENYVRFLFFGGAAVAARRELRAGFLATVLQCNGFVVKQISDRIEALLAKRNAEKTEEALVMVGRLMVASRHLDMVIESPAAANALAHAFLSGDYGFKGVSKTGT